jgi:hypothetical protein
LGGTVDALVGVARGTDGVVAEPLPPLVGMVADEVVVLATHCGDAWKPWTTHWTRCLHVSVAGGTGLGLHHGWMAADAVAVFKKFTVIYPNKSLKSLR